MKDIKIAIAELQHQKLKKLKKENGMPITQQIRLAIEEYLKKREE